MVIAFQSLLLLLGVTMIKKNNITIGNNNTIKNSTIANMVSEKAEKEKWYSKLFWQLIIPIAVAIIVAIICAYFKLK